MFEPRPIGDYVDGWKVAATCRRCRHRTWLDMPAIVARLGHDRSFSDVIRRLVCRQCGVRGEATIGTVPERWGYDGHRDDHGA